MSFDSVSDLSDVGELRISGLTQSRINEMMSCARIGSLIVAPAASRRILDPPMRPDEVSLRVVSGNEKNVSVWSVSQKPILLVVEAKNARPIGTLATGVIAPPTVRPPPCS